MILQVVLMWAIVIGTVIWFVRDERRLREEAEMAAAARYYAHAPQYRHVVAAAAVATPVDAPARRTGGLSQSQRDFLNAFATQA
jgi:hypothetical protein